MTGLFRTTVVEISGVRTISGGGTNASNAGQALLNLSGVSITGNQTIDGIKTFKEKLILDNTDGVVLNDPVNAGWFAQIKISDAELNLVDQNDTIKFALQNFGSSGTYVLTLPPVNGQHFLSFPTGRSQTAFIAVDNEVVHNYGNETISGIKTFITVNESSSVLSITNQTINFPLNSGMNFILPLTTGITGITFSNTPTNTFSFTLRVDYSGAHAIVWPTGTIGRVLWPNNTAPTLTTTVGREDFFSFITYTSGQEFFGFTAGQNYSGIY